MLEAYDEKEVKLISASFMLGYGLIIFFSHSYLKGLKPVNVIAQSVIIGLMFTLFPLILYAKSLSFEGINEEYSQKKLDSLARKLVLGSGIVGIILTVLGILI